MQSEKYAALIPPMQQLIELLVGEEYEAIEHMTGGVRLSSTEIKQAVEDYGKKLTMPPASAWSALDVIEVRDAEHPTFSVRFDLWANGGRTDLTIETTLILRNSEFVLELDDLHVL